MLLEAAIFGTAIGIVLLIIGLFASQPRPPFLAAAAIFLIISGVLIGVDGLQISAGQPCINYTQEVSHVWNCSNYTDTECFGTPLQWSCWAYNETQCRYIDGCSWGIQGGCYGTPKLTCQELYAYGGAEKCRETDGCYIWNEVNPQTCDSYDTYYTYMNCTNVKGAVEGGYSEGWAVMLVIIGIAAMMYGISSFVGGTKQNKE